MMLRNDRRLGVRNGNRGVVLDVDPDERTMRVQLARGAVDVPARYVDAGHVGLAYAMTVNKAHGTTCDATMMLGDDLLYRELAYEAMSRGRKENRIYMSRATMAELDLQLEDGPHARTVDAGDPIDILAAGLERRRNKHLALDSIASVPLEAWSTSDLLAERNRVRSVLDQAPPDRSADLAALDEVATRGRDEGAGDEAFGRRAGIPQATAEGTPPARRHAADPAAQPRPLRTAGRRLDREIAALHASQHRRASHLAAHRADRIELDAIGEVLDERLRQQTNRAVADPPSYITKILGPRPASGAKDRAWVRAVVAIERYRVEHDITDRRTAIGPEPTSTGAPSIGTGSTTPSVMRSTPWTRRGERSTSPCCRRPRRRLSASS